MEEKIKNILVTGGAGYVGAVLVPKLLQDGYKVKVLDLYIYGNDVLSSEKNNPNLEEIKGDLRSIDNFTNILNGIDAVIHLACISNDPSFELNPELGKSINYDASIKLIDLAKKKGVKRFIFASSSSVYGIKNVKNVTEELSLDPLTDYSKFKAEIEKYLILQQDKSFTTLIIRPATVCGYSPRQRLDLTVNILTNHAINNNIIKVFGGKQKRPNIHIEDITDLYVKCLKYSKKKIAGNIFNAGYENHSVREIAEMVKQSVGNDKVSIVMETTDDNRSYHISSEKIKNVLGFEPAYTILDSINDLRNAFLNGKLPNSMSDKKYFNIKTMQELKL